MVIEYYPLKNANNLCVRIVGRFNNLKIKMIARNKSQLVRSAALAIVLLGVSQLTAFATIIFDQGPLTGTFGGGWQNTTSSQNFADQVTFASDTIVGGYNYFTDYDLSQKTGSADFRIKILADADNTPGLVLFSENIGFSSVFTEGGYNGYHFDFAPQIFQSGAKYWVGLSGNDFEAAQISIGNLQGGDGLMAQFAGNEYRFMTNVGDQVFQLTGEKSAGVPDTAVTSLLIGVSLMALIGFRRRFIA